MSRSSRRERDNVERRNQDVDRRAVVAALTILCAAAAAAPLLAHKPITSKFTYNEHVFPILRDRCGSCHVDGGVAPMSLLTYVDALPWAESIRAELVAGHMPPSRVDDTFAPVRRPAPLTPRELDTILTWATGGTPEGPAAAKPQPIALHNDWPLGSPDATIDLPGPVTLAAGELRATREFVVDAGSIRDRHLRAIDLLPGTPAVVRRAAISARSRATGATRTLEEWLPGDSTVAAPDDAYFALGADDEIVVTVEYRKTWKYENQAVSDRSRIGFYAARPAASREIAALGLSTTATALDRDVKAVAVEVKTSQPDEEVAIRAVRPDGTRLQLLAATASPEWPQRFWFVKPVALVKGTRVEVVGEKATAEISLIADR